jgi:hypothetical protein
MYVGLGVVGVGIGWGVSKGGLLVDWGQRWLAASNSCRFVVGFSPVNDRYKDTDGNVGLFSNRK